MIEQQIDASTHQVLQGRRSAAIGHELKLQPRETFVLPNARRSHKSG
jgi:hypothetical protein